MEKASPFALITVNRIGAITIIVSITAQIPMLNAYNYCHLKEVLILIFIFIIPFSILFYKASLNYLFRFITLLYGLSRQL